MPIVLLAMPRPTLWMVVQGRRSPLRYRQRQFRLPLGGGTRNAGDQAFTFTGTGKFSNTASELRCEKTKADTYVYGDGKADFVLHIDAALTLRADDFLLYPRDWAVMQQ
ncbi:hypothetical protein [Shinella sp. M31]|uniref:hypothetical protein n=1 Tax=Shinella sp. M31 TaxID=3368615 RepID=UPI003B9EA5F6